MEKNTKALNYKYHDAKNLTLKFYRKKKRKTKHWLFFTDRAESGDGKWEFIITPFSHLCFFANKKKLLKRVSSITFAWPCHWNRVLGIRSVSTHSVHSSVLLSRTTASRPYYCEGCLAPSVPTLKPAEGFHKTKKNFATKTQVLQGFH